MSDFDFFGGPTTPPPSAPPPGGAFGAPAPSQLGAPTTNQFGMPVTATAPVSVTPAAVPVGSGSNRTWIVAGAVVAACVLLYVALGMLQSQGKKSAAKVTSTVETPIVKAHQTEETIDLQQAATAQETYLADHGSYATSLGQLTGLVVSPGDVLTVVSAGPTTYCLRADDTSNFHAPSMYLSSATGGASTTPCS